MTDRKLRNTVIAFIFFLIVVVLLVVFLTRSKYINSENVSVETSIGEIRGLFAEDGKYLMFLGIPYGRVDKSNPFSPSLPYPNFEEVFVANDDSAICPQVDNLDVSGVKTLECLNLNIYTPQKIEDNQLFPVMVYIHGGSFRTGSNNRYINGPKFIVQHDVILVTINYRIGIYGFMCLDIPEVPGNQGLKDQLLALRWIKKHIKAFGGDENNITIFGQSAGARSVDLHLIADKEKLFHNAILQSGNSLCPPGVSNIDNELTVKVANHLGLQTTNVTEALQFLSSAETELVNEATSELGYTMFRACVEKEFDNVESFLTEHPLVKVSTNIKDTPILMGYNDNERMSFYSGTNIESYGLDNLIKSSLENYFNFDEETLEKMEEIVQRFYLSQPITEETRQDIINFDSDFVYVHPIQRRIKDYTSNGASVVYHYKFSFDSTRNFVKYNSNISLPGAVHADELSYLFDVTYLKDIMSQNEQLTVDRLTTLWTNFAKFGDPTPEISELLPVKWEPVTSEVLYYYNIGSNLTLGNRPFNRRLSFWDLFFEINGHLQKGFGEEF